VTRRTRVFVYRPCRAEDGVLQLAVIERGIDADAGEGRVQVGGKSHAEPPFPSSSVAQPAPSSFVRLSFRRAFGYGGRIRTECGAVNDLGDRHSVSVR